MRYSCIILILFLAGCTPVPDRSLPLAEQLAGRPPAEQRQILKLDCLNDAETITAPIHARKAWMSHDSVETRTMKTLCFAMLDTRRSDKPAERHLAHQCGDQLAKIAHLSGTKTIPGNLLKMKTVCEAMTGEPVVIQSERRREPP